MKNNVETNLAGIMIRIRGTVQGVGFRPNVYRLAKEYGISGCVLNDGEGVLIEAWAERRILNAFIAAIRDQKPLLSKIESIEQREIEERPAVVPQHFQIAASSNTDISTNISADAATCKQCLEEVKDPFNRRFRYPFTNCTNCGPRLSIVTGIPYDRSQTTMAAFMMCDLCRAEYEDPLDRRFHAQANACHACGPKARLERMDGRALSIESLTQLDDVDAALTLIQKGEIVAIKGVGGYHLAADALNEQAVARLRSGKLRKYKPFALMARDLDVIRYYCHVSEAEEAWLVSPIAPIVLLDVNDRNMVAHSVAPNQRTLGFMLPYTALHHLLLMRMTRPIVLTSGNFSEEPQCTDDAEVRTRLSKLADYALVNTREIANRLDDSVVRVVAGQRQVLRRARGYAPEPISLPKGFERSGRTLALGGELKNTFCLIEDGRAIVSQHLGDLEEARTYLDYEHNLALYKNLFAFEAERIVVDLHPDYLSSKLGGKMSKACGLPLLAAQHHHAHIASVLAENNYPLDGADVLGIALDGLGLGQDGSLWGGEFLRASYSQCERLGTFKPVCLLGGSQAMREPWRNTYAHLMAEMGWVRYKLEYDALELTRFFESKPLKTFNGMLVTGENAPFCSSAGRLFDAVAAAAGICRDTATYEGQAAIELENASDPRALQDDERLLGYPFAVPMLKNIGLPYIEPLSMWHAVFADLLDNTPAGIISARFHKGLARAIVYMALKLINAGEEPWTSTVALSGGVFQNKILSRQVSIQLEEEGLKVLVHAKIPPNDGGLSLGQAVIGAACALRAGGA